MDCSGVFGLVGVATPLGIGSFGTLDSFHACNLERIAVTRFWTIV